MVLGLTGGIASGKSTLGEWFGELGAAVVSADQLAREAVRPGSVGLGKLVDLFGDQILAADGSLDRTALGQKVFADPEARQRLEAVTHPQIASLAERRLGELRAAGQPLIVYEAALLFEAGAESRVDLTLVVLVEPEVQLQRLMDREGWDAAAARARIDAQDPQADKVVRADFVIDNSGARAAAQKAVSALRDYLLR